MKRRMTLATCLTLLLAIVGCGGSSEYSATLDTHTLTIIDAPEGPSGGTSLTNRDDAAETETHTFESADERYKIELENEVLTINGDRYTLDKPESTIRIEDDRVAINGVTVSPNTK